MPATEAQRAEDELFVEDFVRPGAEDPRLEDYIRLTERIADDPDAAPPSRYAGLCRSYAVAGALVGLQHGGPVILSVDRDALIASGA